MQTRFLGAFLFAALSASMARAALVMNFRFADGSTTHTLTAADVGSDVEIDVWATITGTGAPTANNFFGLTFAYYDAVSSLPHGAGTSVNGGIDGSADAFVAPFSSHGSLGVAQDFNGDGVTDVGSSSGVTGACLALAPFVAPNQISVASDNPAATANALAKGYEFEVEKLYFHVNSLAVGETDFSPLIPAVSGENVGANWFQDSTNDVGSPSSIMNGVYTAGSTVRLISVPEPSSLAAILAVCGFMTRRRKSK